MDRHLSRTRRSRCGLQLEKWLHQFIGPLGNGLPILFLNWRSTTHKFEALRASCFISGGAVLMLYSAFPILLSVAVAQASPAPAVRDGSHDFDFSAGTWKTELTIIKDPFGNPNKQVHLNGTKVARPIWGGKAWLEEIRAPGWEAANLFLYDPVAGQWSENYVDSSVGHMEAPDVGEMHDGKLVFYSVQPVGGRSMLIRGTWTIATKDAHSYEVARSNDGGRTWHTSFVAKVTRAE